jgi:hypothetical protein
LDSDCAAQPFCGLDPYTVLAGWSGLADVVQGVSLEGEGDLYYEHMMSGADYCRVAHDLQSVRVRSDCADCDWAFEVELTNTETPDGPGCVDALGASFDPSSMDGSTLSIGFAATWTYGRTTFYDVGFYYFEFYSEWIASSYAHWWPSSATEGEFEYDFPFAWYYF